jgi:hypothetical protein
MNVIAETSTFLLIYLEMDSEIVYTFNQICNRTFELGTGMESKHI